MHTLSFLKPFFAEGLLISPYPKRVLLWLCASFISSSGFSPPLLAFTFQPYVAQPQLFQPLLQMFTYKVFYGWNVYSVDDYSKRVLRHSLQKSQVFSQHLHILLHCAFVCSYAYLNLFTITATYPPTTYLSSNQLHSVSDNP